MRRARYAGVVVVAVGVVLVGIYASGQPDVTERNEAWQLIQTATQYWNAGQYSYAKEAIDAKLAERPGWIPAAILASGHYRWVESDLDAVEAVLDTIATAVAGLDSVKYAEFLAMYSLYQDDIGEESGLVFSEADKVARLNGARTVYSHYPGSEIVAAYFLWMKKPQ